MRRGTVRQTDRQTHTHTHTHTEGDRERETRVTNMHFRRLRVTRNVANTVYLFYTIIKTTSVGDGSSVSDGMALHGKQT